MIRGAWGVAQSFPVVLVAAGSTDLKSSPTLSSGDFKISKDGGAFSNLTNLPTVSPSGDRQVIISLTAAEWEFGYAVITAIDGTAPKEWADNGWRLVTPLFGGGLAGKITSGTPTTTSFVSSQLTGAQTDHHKDIWIKFLTGACANAICRLTAFNPGSDTATVSALPTAPAVGDVWEALL